MFQILGGDVADEPLVYMLFMHGELVLFSKHSKRCDISTC